MRSKPHPVTGSRTLPNMYRKKMRAYAKKHNICGTCFSHPTTGSTGTICAKCHRRRERYRIRKAGGIRRPVGRPRGTTRKKRVLPTKAELRAKKRLYNATYKRRALIKKVMKLDRIKYAVLRGKPLPASSTLIVK